MAELQNGSTMMSSHSEINIDWNKLIVPEDTAFATLFNMQMKNQKQMFDKGMYEGFTSVNSNDLPNDDIRLMSYHVMQLMSEIGELLDSDKRWKNFRNEKFEKDEKLKELADCFIVLMNVVMFSGFSAREIVQAIADKIVEVKRRMG
jgi:predicted house-cleaning noncanonical NTP pyrophosphatase (MazG superfamily)